ncbi:MAG: LuxR C-terminal-related transcriptional regulator [Ilumatobacteraceae bacterium]
MSLGIRCTVLASRSLGRVAPAELEAIFDGAGAPVVPSERSSLFETDPSGRLVRWPLPWTGDDHSLPGQVVVADRARSGRRWPRSSPGPSARTSWWSDAATTVSIPVRVLARRSPARRRGGCCSRPNSRWRCCPTTSSAGSPSASAGGAAAGERPSAPSGGRASLLSHNTVRNHLKSIFTKLDVSSQQELIARIVEPSAAPTVT